jgi:hypothetical protein
MTQKSLLELLMADYPDRGDAYFRTLANTVLAEFSEQTRLLLGHETIAAEPGKVVYALPAGVIEVFRVLSVRDEQMREVRVTTTVTADLHEGEEVFLPGVDEDGAAVISWGRIHRGYLVPVDGGEAEVFYVRRATPLTPQNLDAEIDLPGEFQAAIEARIRERLSAGNPEERSYWFAVWRDMTRKAKQRANSGTDGTRIYTIKLPVI